MEYWPGPEPTGIYPLSVTQENKAEDGWTRREVTDADEAICILLRMIADLKDRVTDLEANQSA